MTDTLLHSLAAVAIVLAIVAMGYVFARKGYIRHEHKGLIVKLIISAGMPALVVSNVLGSLDLESMERPLLLFLLPLLSMLATLALGLLLAKLLKLSALRRGGFVAMCAFSNSIFVGLPMNTGLFGDAAVPYVMCFYTVNTTLFWTVGNYLIHRSGESGGDASGAHRKHGFKRGLKKLLSPPLIALMIAIPLLILEYELNRLPAFTAWAQSWAGWEYVMLIKRSFLKMCGYIGNIVTPLALFYVGATLHEYGFKSLRPDRCMWGVLGMRSIVAPAVMLGLCMLFGFDGVGCGVFVVEAAMPVMTQAVVLAADCNADESFVAAGMCLTTLECFILVPVLMLIMTAMGLV